MSIFEVAKVPNLKNTLKIKSKEFEKIKML